VKEVVVEPPDVLHCWLDQPNVIGAIAGLLADVPHVLLSARNSAPPNFPRIHYPYLHRWYQTVARSDRVHLLANSRSGAASYADWLGEPLQRFHVVLNGVCLEHFPEPSPEARRPARRSFGLSEKDRVVCGVFRLAAEKQPELFVEVIRNVAARVPGLRVLLAGAGDLAEKVAGAVASAGLGEQVRLLGRQTDVARVFLAS